MNTVHLSNGKDIQTDLVVYRDWVESNGQWRLFWANREDPYKGVQEQSTVTGQPFFKTRKEAVAHGVDRYSKTATTAVFHHN